MSDTSKIETQQVPTMYFFGVTTASSSSRRMFPQWASILGLHDAQLIGVDLPLDAPADDYRRAVLQIKHDELSLGALVTTHKMNVFRAAYDLFDTLTADARLCGEVSCIYKQDGRLIGHATDPVTSGLAMREFIPADYWSISAADVLCLGSGGAAVALATHFVVRAEATNRPKKMLVVDRDVNRLNHLRSLVQNLPDASMAFEYYCHANARKNDKLMAHLPPGSMIVNATGMGKDLPSSPITNAGIFPQNGIVWELNYRGALDFLQQAQAQAFRQNLTIEDGWTYFLIGWAYIVSPVFDVEITPQQFSQLAQAAESIR